MSGELITGPKAGAFDGGYLVAIVHIGGSRDGLSYHGCQSALSRRLRRRYQGTKFGDKTVTKDGAF